MIDRPHARSRVLFAASALIHTSRHSSTTRGEFWENSDRPGWGGIECTGTVCGRLEWGAQELVVDTRGGSANGQTLHFGRYTP